MDNELRRDKIVAGMKERLMEGYWVWSAPRGYDNLNQGKGKASERKLVINQEGKLLRKAFEWKAYQQLLNVEIARRLNKMGMNISEKRMIELFSNPFYCGLIVSKMLPGQVIEGKHEPLISRELFLKVHNIRQKSRSHSFVHNRDNDNLPLKVFLKCDKCKQTLTGYLVKKKGLYYYKCSTKGVRQIEVLKLCTTTQSQRFNPQKHIQLMPIYPQLWGYTEVLVAMAGRPEATGRHPTRRHRKIIKDDRTKEKLTKPAHHPIF